MHPKTPAEFLKAIAAENLLAGFDAMGWLQRQKTSLRAPSWTFILILFPVEKALGQMYKDKAVSLSVASSQLMKVAALPLQGALASTVVTRRNMWGSQSLSSFSQESPCASYMQFDLRDPYLPCFNRLPSPSSEKDTVLFCPSGAASRSIEVENLLYPPSDSQTMYCLSHSQDSLVFWNCTMYYEIVNTIGPLTVLCFCIPVSQEVCAQWDRI